MEVNEFVEKMSEKSLEDGWNPSYVLNGEKIFFAKIADKDELMQISKICENDYLDKISTTRKEWLGLGGSLVEFERELCKRDLYYLGKFVLGYDHAVFHLHKFMAGSMENLPKGYRGLREFPRDSYKSTFMVISFIVQEILRDNACRILIKSNVGKNASQKLIEVKAHFIDDTILSRLFPEHKSQKVSERGSGKVWHSPAKIGPQAEGTITASGVGESNTSQHYTLIIGDDFWDQKSVTSPEVTAKIKEELGGIEYLLAAPPIGKIVFVGTRFSFDDPTIDFVKNPLFHCIIVSGIMKTGRSIFPEQIPIASMFGQYIGYPYVFSCQMMLNPSKDDAGFKGSWFKYLTEREVDKLVNEHKISKRTVLLTDAAGAEKAESDPIAIMAVDILSDGRKFVRKYLREKMSPEKFINTCFNFADRYRPEYIVRQKAPLETALMSFFQKENVKRKKAGKRFVQIYDFSLAKKSKLARMGALQPEFSQGNIYFNPDDDMTVLLEREILSFPYNMTNDDGMDALSELCDPEVARIPKHKAIIEEPDHSPVTINEIKNREKLYRRECAMLSRKKKKPRRRKVGEIEL